MLKVLKRMKRSPRLGRVTLAVCAPALFSVGFAPLWAQLASLLMTFSAMIYMYASVLSHRPATKQKKTPGLPEVANVGQEQAGKDEEATTLVMPDTIFQEIRESTEPQASEIQASLDAAQREIRTVLDTSAQAARQLDQYLRELESNHKVQTRLAQELLQRTSPTEDQQPSLSDVTHRALLTLRELSECFNRTTGDPSKDTEDILGLTGLVDHLSHKLNECKDTLNAMGVLEQEMGGHIHLASVALNYQDDATRKLQRLNSNYFELLAARTSQPPSHKTSSEREPTRNAADHDTDSVHYVLHPAVQNAEPACAR